MPYEYKSHGSTWVRTRETVWPRLTIEDPTLEWTLRYGNPSTSDLLAAASIIAAYDALICLPAWARGAVVRAMREADRLDALAVLEGAK